MSKKTLTLENENGEKTEYIYVAERISKFWKKCKDGSIETEVMKQTETFVLIKATVAKKGGDSKGTATGHASGTLTADGEKEFEKIETVAIGRALANLGFAASETIASADEMELKGKKLHWSEEMKKRMSARSVRNGKKIEVIIPVSKMGDDELMKIFIKELKKLKSLKALKKIISESPVHLNNPEVVKVIKELNKKFKK